MALTRLDCHLYRGANAAHDGSSFVAFNPSLQPAQMVFAGSAAVRESVGSQVAYRLALDYFMLGVEAHYAQPAGEARVPGDEGTVVKALEDAFRSANTSVYGFGHKLAAGGRMAASLLGVVIEAGRLATGRVGYGSVYLFRNNELFPFFDTPESEVAKVGDARECPDEFESRRSSFIGSNSMVDVELASVMLQADDVLCVFSRPLTTLNETVLFECLESLSFDTPAAKQPAEVAERLCNEVFTEPESLAFAMVARVGPEAIYCNEVLG